MKIVGICSGHDCSYAVLENGIPIIHNELERFIRQKEPIADALEFLFDTYDKLDDIKHISYCVNSWNGGIKERYPDTYSKALSIVEKNGGKFWPNNDTQPGHHQCHAANAFFSSNCKDALIVTIDGGGEDYYNGQHTYTAFTVWQGNDNKIHPLDIIPMDHFNIGRLWNHYTTQVFGLSGTGDEKGSQAGTVMGMAALGDETRFRDTIMDKNRMIQLASESEQNRFDIAAALQSFTEDEIRNKISYYLQKYPNKNLCLSGGVALNCVLVGKIKSWFPEIENIYVDPVPSDAGIALGGPRYIWHHILDNPRIEWKDNATPYLGYEYHIDNLNEQLDKNKNVLEWETCNDDDVIELLTNQKIISICNKGSESGRRALGNRSILADPRSDKMKDLINDKVKHRQWFRPFAPSILREEVNNWFKQDVNSPYMSFAIAFKDEMKDKVPAVVHFDGTARLQTVSKNDNEWYYNLIKKFKEKTGVPILLNTSFNDREPIVETPEHAINCFLGTDIDYLYFPEHKIICTKKK